MDRELFSGMVKKTRSPLRLTQEQFAHRLGVTCITVNRWENCRTTPSPIALKLIKKELADLGEKGQEVLNRYLKP